MKYLSLALCLTLGSILMYVASFFPAWGDPHSPASTHLSPYFIENAVPDTAVPNIVSAVLADYRGYDTMFETAVVFTAAMACFFLLRSFVRGRGPEGWHSQADTGQGDATPRARTGDALYRHEETGIVLRCKEGRRIENAEAGNEAPYASGIGEDAGQICEFSRIDSVWMPEDIITSTVCRLLIPFIQLYALYVVAHGHHSPGGGFQGGVTLGASFILYALANNLRSLCSRFAEKSLMLILALGVVVYAGTGIVCMFEGANFLDYSALAGLLHTDPIYARSLGILFVETGVAMTVMATMILIYNYISSQGRCDEGL